ncbi:MAG: RNA polymerase sigma factor [Ruminococcaceae bacterium]|nr:RNA polymerase sigma factor [Oscillospiraceae bacterium]
MKILIFLLTVLDAVHGNHLEALYRTYKNMVYSHAYSIVNNRQDAEELVQDVFLKAYFNIQTLENRTKEDVVLWLKICTKHRAIDLLRKKTSKGRSAPIYEGENGDASVYEIPDDSGIPEKMCIEREQMQLLLLKINELPQEQCSAVICRYYYNMRIKEIAGILGKSGSAVSALINRAKQTLQKELGEDFYE